MVGVCEACAGPAGWHRTQWHFRTGGLQCPLSLCVYVSGPALPLHALHHWRAVAETPTIQTWSCFPEQPVFTAVPLLLSTGKTTTINKGFPSLILHHGNIKKQHKTDFCTNVLPIKRLRPHRLQNWNYKTFSFRFSDICCHPKNECERNFICFA